MAVDLAGRRTPWWVEGPGKVRSPGLPWCCRCGFEMVVVVAVVVVYLLSAAAAEVG